MADEQPHQQPNENPEEQPNTNRGSNADASAHPDPNEAANTVKKKKTSRRVLGILLWLLLLVLVLGVSALIFVQLPFFRRMVVGELVKVVESSTNGTLVIKDIEGNILNGFVLNDVSLRLRTGTQYDSVTILHADHILADYSLIRWLRKNEIGITNMVIQHPVIRLVKFAGDTVWNYHLLFKPVPTAPKAPPQPFTQLVDLASFRIQDGTVLVRDYNYPERATKTVGTSAVRAQVKENEIEWSDAQIQGLDLDSRLYVNGSAAQSVKVNHLRFTETQSGFFVQHLEFAGYIDSIQARIDNAKITTGHSNISFSIEAAPPKIITTGLLTSMEHSSVTLTMKGPTISTYELKQFLPKPLGFLSGSPGIDLMTHGEFGHLHIDRLGLDFKQRGNILISGDLHNLQQPNLLRMNIMLQARNLSNATLNDYVPGLHLPDLSRFGTINIPSLTYNGVPLNFHTVFDAKTSGAGNAKGDVVLDLRQYKFIYRAGLKTDQFNLAAFTGSPLKGAGSPIKGAGSPSWASSISADAQLTGSGTNWKTLTTDLTFKTTAPSTFQKYHITNLDLAGTMKQGTATVQHMEAVAEGGPEVHVRSATIDLVSPSVPYRFDGTVNNFRLAEVLGNNSRNPARIDLDANVSGIGKQFEDLSGTIHARLFDLAYQGHPIQDVKVDATFAPASSGENNLTIQSDMADVTIEHRFHLADLIHTVPEHIRAFVTAIRNRGFPDSLQHTPFITQCSDSIDFDYYFRIKDLRPLADFIPQTFLLGEGAISGSVYGCPQGDISLSMKGDSLGFILRNRSGQSIDSALAAEDFVALSDSFAHALVASNTLAALHSRFGDSILALRDTLRRRGDSTFASSLALPKFGAGTPRVHITPSAFHLEAHNISNDPHKVFDHLDASLDFLADSVVRLGSALLYHPKFGLVYKDRTLDFDLATVYNDVLGLRLKGDAHFPKNEFDFALDTLQAVYFNRASGAREYRLFNQGITHVRIAQNGAIDIDTLTIVHPTRRGYNPNYVFAQRMSLGGKLEGDTVHAWARMADFNLRELRDLPMKPNAKTLDFAQYDGTVRDLSLNLDGTLERPEIAAKLFVDSMKYNEGDNEVSFDSSSVDLSYRDQALRGTVVVHSPNVQAVSRTLSQQTVNAGVATMVALLPVNELRAQIDSIPMLIAFKHGLGYSADSAAVLTRPLSANIKAASFPIDLAAPFIPAFKALHGSGDINFDVTGTQEHIQYGGSARVKDGELQLAATNLWYLFDGSVVFANNALNLQNITLKNVAGDDPYGSALVNGFFNFQGFNITKFDLALHTDRLMVLSNDSRGPLPVVYGPLTINTGGSDFHFYNTFQAPAIKGNITIMSAAITLPQSGNSTQSVTSEGIVYRTLPNDSMLETGRADTVHAGSARAALAYAVNSGSVRMTAIDDTVFPNSMKNIYLNDDGTIRNVDSLTGYTAPASNVTQASFADKLRMNMQVNIQGDTWVYMPFSGMFGILGAQLSAELRSNGPILIERGDDLITHVAGTLDLTPNSTFRFYQTFNITSGKISFTDNFSNPEIDVVADYIGQDVGAQNQPQAKIELSVTGTKSQPQLTARNYVQNSSGTFDPKPETGSEALDDAIYFLASGGYFKNELSDPAATNILGSLSKNLTSNLLGSMITNFTGSTSSAFAIRSTQLNYGQSMESVGFTAAYRDITFRYAFAHGTGANAAISGGANPLLANYVFDIPLTSITSARAARDMQLEIQVNENSPVVGAGSIVQQPVFLTKWIWTPWRF